MKSNIYKKKISRIIRSLVAIDSTGEIRKYLGFRQKKKSQELINYYNSIELPPVIIRFPSEISKPIVGIVADDIIYYVNFIKYCDTNSIDYRIVDIHNSTFIKELEGIDILIWRTPSSYASQWEATDKIEFISDYLGKMTLPTKESLWFYEDKVREQWLFDHFNLPSIKTFISYSEEESLEYIKTAKFPLILKDRTCSSSEGVLLIKNSHQAKRICKKIFLNGRKVFEPYVRQKNYVLFQEFVPNEGFDLRVIVVGQSYFGYYRYPKGKDYRASGSGIVRKESIPIEVLQLARQAKECFPKSYLLAVDFLQDSRDKKYYIIETSIFISIETPEQLVVDGKPGRYIEKDGVFIFEEGRFWLPELMMDELMKDWIKNERARL